MELSEPAMLIEGRIDVDDRIGLKLPARPVSGSLEALAGEASEDSEDIRAIRDRPIGNASF